MEPHLLSIPLISSKFCRHSYIDAQPYAPLRPVRSHSSDKCIAPISFNQSHNVMLSPSLNTPSPPIYRWRSELHTLPHSYKQTRDKLRQILLSSSVRPGEETVQSQPPCQHLPVPPPGRSLSCFHGGKLGNKFAASTKTLTHSPVEYSERNKLAQFHSFKNNFNANFPFILDNSFQSNWSRPEVSPHSPHVETKLTKFRLFSFSIPEVHHLAHASHLFPHFNKSNLHVRRYKVQEHAPCHFSQIELQKMEAPDLKPLPNFYPSSWNNRLVYLHGRRRPIDITSNELYLIGHSQQKFDHSRILSVSVPYLSPSRPVDSLPAVRAFESSSCSNLDRVYLRAFNNSDYMECCPSPPPSSPGAGSDLFVFTRANSYESTPSPVFSTVFASSPENCTNRSPSSSMRCHSPKFPLNIRPRTTESLSSVPSRSIISSPSSTSEFQYIDTSLKHSRVSDLEIFSDATACAQYSNSHVINNALPVLKSMSSGIDLISNGTDFNSPSPSKQLNMNPHIHLSDTPYSTDIDGGHTLLNEVIKNQENHLSRLIKKNSSRPSSQDKGKKDLVFKEVPVKWRVFANPLVENKDTSLINNNEVICSKVSQSLRGSPFTLKGDNDAPDRLTGNTLCSPSSDDKNGNPINSEFIGNLIDELVFGIDFYNLAILGESRESRNSSKQRPEYSSSRNRERGRMSRQLHRHQASSCARRLNLIREQRRANYRLQLAMKQREKLKQRRKRLNTDGLENLFNITHAYTFSYFPFGRSDGFLSSDEESSVIR